MILQQLVLTNFRSYTHQLFDFSDNRTIIIGANTAGKTNVIEAITILSIGKSFKTDKDVQLIHFGETITKAKGIGMEHDEKLSLEVIFSQNGNGFPIKK